MTAGLRPGTRQLFQVATDEASESSSKKSAVAGVPAWIVAIAETCAVWKKSFLPSVCMLLSFIFRSVGGVCISFRGGVDIMYRHYPT